MTRLLPRTVIRRTARGDWTRLPPLQPFFRADGSTPALEQTTARLGHDGDVLFVRFDCADRDIWGTYSKRDDPLYEEEVVEIFLAPGDADPVEYFEIEVSPLGILFDARVGNPTGRRADMTVETSWDCPGIVWRAGSEPARWWAEIEIPWRSLAPRSANLPRRWRGNLFRIERPRGGTPEMSCWSPTFTEPPDFHRPAFFGYLEIEG